MRYALKGQETEPLGLVFTEIHDGRPRWSIKDENGLSWDIVELNKDGTLFRCKGVECPGIQTDEDGRIKLSKGKSKSGKMPSNSDLPEMCLAEVRVADSVHEVKDSEQIRRFVYLDDSGTGLSAFVVLDDYGRIQRWLHAIYV